MTTEHLTPPHGGELCNLIVDEDRAEQLRTESGAFPSITLNLRQICDLELLKTLPKREVLCGFAEIIKHGAIADRVLLEFIRNFEPK